MIMLPDTKKFLYVKPIFDDLAIQYLVLTEPLRDYARELGYEVIALEGGEATPEAVHSAILTHDPFFVFSSGHGCSSVHTTVDYKDALWVSPGCAEHSHADDKVQMLRDRVTYLLSCYCGKELVPAIVKAGGRTAVGYSDEFLWVVDTDSPINEDPFAVTFFDCPNYFMSLILEGENIRDAYYKTVDKYDYWIKQWETWIVENPNADAYHRSRAFLSINLLEHDRNIMSLYGEEFNVAGIVKMGNSLPMMLFLLAIVLQYITQKWSSRKESLS